MPKRQDKRSPTFLRGFLEGDDQTLEIRVRDVSVNGALLDVSEQIPVFVPITLVCGLSRINGIVVWCENGRAGIEFAEPISGRTLSDSLENKLRVSAPKQYRDGEFIGDEND